MLRASLWMLTAFIVSVIMAWISEEVTERKSMIHNVAYFFSGVFSVACWGCLVWLIVDIVIWAVPHMIGG